MRRSRGARRLRPVAVELGRGDPVAVRVRATDRDGALVVASFAVERLDGRAQFGMGIVRDTAVESPQCGLMQVWVGDAGVTSFASEQFVFPFEAESLWTVDSIEAGRAYVETDDYATLRAILLSLQMPAAP